MTSLMTKMTTMIMIMRKMTCLDLTALNTANKSSYR